MALRVGLLAAIAVAALAATKALLPIQPFPFILPLAAVVVSAVVGGVVAGAITTLFCAAVIAWFIVSPLTATSHTSLIAFGLTGLVMAWVAGRLRVSRVRLREACWRSSTECRFFSEANKRLGESIDYDETLRCIAEFAVGNLGTWCAVAVLDAHRRPRIVAAETAEPSQWPSVHELTERCAIDLRAEHGLGRVLRTGEPELLREVTQEGGGAPPPELRAFRVRSYMAVPLRARGEILGALALADSERRFEDPELAVAEELADRCAAALDNAAHHRSTEDAKREREEILAIVSHDLRGPLNVITASASALERSSSRGSLEQTAREVSRLLSRSAARMNRLIEDLLDFAAIESGRLSIARAMEDAASLVAEAIETWQPAAKERDVDLLAELPTAALTVECDRDRILQALSNLLSNAIAVTPKRRAVTVSARAEEGSVVFCVKDVGPGVPPAALPHMFDRYWRGPNAYKGAGLGLSIAKSVVELHGGRIWADSAVGAGSTFSFSLPVNRAAATDVLLVEDDADARDGISRALRLRGYEVATAADGHEAWELLHRGPPPCLILLDVMMPVMNGPEFLDLLHADARLRSVPVVVVSAFGSLAAPVAARSQGYLPKPIDLDELLAVSARHCAHLASRPA